MKDYAATICWVTIGVVATVATIVIVNAAGLS